MFKRAEGHPNIQWYPKKASTAFTNGALVYADGSGAIQPADSTSGMHLGVILKSVAAADEDYASMTKVPVDVPRPGDVFEADVSGTLTTAMIGNTYDLSSSLVVNVGAQSKNVVTAVGFISSTKGLFSVNAMVHHTDVATT